MFFDAGKFLSLIISCFFLLLSLPKFCVNRTLKIAHLRLLKIQLSGRKLCDNYSTTNTDLYIVKVPNEHKSHSNQNNILSTENYNRFSKKNFP